MDFAHARGQCHSWDDVSVIGEVMHLSHPEGRHALRVDGKWHVTFDWFQGFGASNIALERR